MTTSLFSKPLDWLRPRRICERTGECDYCQRVVRGFQYPSRSYRGVADEVSVNIHQCRRCGKRQKMEDDHVISRDAIHSLSMPSCDWVKLRERGFIEQ